MSLRNVPHVLHPPTVSGLARPEVRNVRHQKNPSSGTKTEQGPSAYDVSLHVSSRIVPRVPPTPRDTGLEGAEVRDVRHRQDPSSATKILHKRVLSSILPSNPLSVPSSILPYLPSVLCSTVSSTPCSTVLSIVSSTLCSTVSFIVSSTPCSTVSPTYILPHDLLSIIPWIPPNIKFD